MTQALGAREALRRSPQEELESIDLDNTNKSQALIIDDELSRSEDFDKSSPSSLEVSSAYSKDPNSDKGKEEEPV